MHVTRPDPKDESGTTIVELLVGISMGMIVLVGLTLTLVNVLHGTARVDARVEATDNARVTVAGIMEQLHSACVSPQIAPIQKGSTGTTLIFWHAAPGEASAVQPTPVKSKIVLSGTTLTEYNYAKTAGNSPKLWEFEPETGGNKTILLSNVAAPPETSSIFTYEKFEKGKQIPMTATELTTVPEIVIRVNLALTASPRNAPVADKSSAATIEDGATLRLTPPSFNSEASALPCQ
jgi:hypothetical protein